MQVNLSKKHKNKAFANKNDKAIFLFFGLALWMFVPILGIFPLLYFIHLNRKPNSKLNLLLILLVILTNTIFVSSLDVISDLAVYTANYERLDGNNPFEISGEQGVEFVLWLLSYPVFLISNGSKYAFIFFWSFFFNAVTFLVIAKKLSPQNYALLSMFIIATPGFLDIQGFFVRQYIATVIFLVAVVYAEKKLVMWGVYIFSLCTHFANIIYLGVLFVYDKAKFLRRKYVKIIIFAAGLFLPFSNAILLRFVFLVVRFMPAKYAAIIIAKTQSYANIRSSQSSFGVPFLEGFVIFCIIMFLLKEKKFETPTEKLLLFLHPILLFLMFIGRDIHHFSYRFAFVLYTFGGLFYYFLIEYKWKGFKKEILPSMLFLKILFFCYFLYNINSGNNPFHYLDDEVFSSSVFDYIQIAHDGFTYDIEIENLPNRTIRLD
ncbi:EpsG family protein [Myxosarcina sp. GI1]|uniref:EpsG family protein n=1 Tax=Myxosarcina sp. GI1 TaxID=1541065 RepID=UPI0005612DAA|nr:EpsG family protein [Myxosarcina sp. GI1]